MLVGYPPFVGQTFGELAERIRLGRVFFHREDWSDVSVMAINFIRKLLNPDKN
jgi:hypothetical protein